MRVKVMAIQTLYRAGKYRWLLLHGEFRSFSGNLGIQQPLDYREEPIPEYSMEEKRAIYTIAWVVDHVCSKTPWKSECLVRAFCAKQLLKKAGIPCTIYMGVAVDPKEGMIAHAWTTCGAYYVTGEGGHEKYAVTTIFHS